MAAASNRRRATTSNSTAAARCAEYSVRMAAAMTSGPVAAGTMTIRAVRTTQSSAATRASTPRASRSGSVMLGIVRVLLVELSPGPGLLVYPRNASGRKAALSPLGHHDYKKKPLENPRSPTARATGDTGGPSLTKKLAQAAQSAA